MCFDHKMLRNKIVKEYENEGVFATLLGISEDVFQEKMSGYLDFEFDEVKKIAKILRILPSEMEQYFFAPKV